MFQSSYAMGVNLAYTANAGEPEPDRQGMSDSIPEGARDYLGRVCTVEPLCVPGDLESLSLIAAYVLDAAKMAGLDKKSTYGLRLAVDEIATNIVTHGYHEANLKGDIVVCIYLDDRSLMVSLEDTARPYNPRLHPVPDQLSQSLEERQIGGLGIYLALKYVDDFMYAYVNGKNYNMFVMYRQKGE